MPQTLSDDWKSDLGADANRIHETYVHTIGNLTLTGYNSEYQNKRFSDKVDCTDKTGNAIGYRHTPIKISSYLTTVSKWGEDEILARAEMLSDELITIWKYPKKTNCSCLLKGLKPAICFRELLIATGIEAVSRFVSEN